ncbi:hypothetical protein AAFF_G00305280 [Aldrovandia affinis]|uniref:Uncharacterized protein n=1 Tax=Aldrovandia affinis TaxID=143900 RepID=A0AAD7SQJ8_9TELE|nr:hypothetical protein AAFF_G00305280 [Aldrovandia affinis]
MRGLSPARRPHTRAADVKGVPADPGRFPASHREERTPLDGRSPGEFGSSASSEGPGWPHRVRPLSVGHLRPPVACPEGVMLGGLYAV